VRNFGQPFSGAQAELAFGGDIASGSPNKIAVQRVQEWLCYHGKATEVDEDFGPHTKSLVKAFQSGHALPATGVVNAATWAALTGCVPGLPCVTRPGATSSVWEPEWSTWS
jgi:peptidoglycan hydrolase-like protein with peptidoglycan-binding domain